MNIKKKNGARGIIFNLQRYSIHDGPGIRTTIFFKGCPLSCYWCQNPESQNIKPEILFDKTKCTSCGLCIDACPEKANFITSNQVNILRNKCKACGICVEVCPNEARKCAGKLMFVDEVLNEILRDQIFYKNSGGGVTLSGGEPLMQPEFSLEILKKCKEFGLHTTLDTCGYASWEVIEPILEYADLVLYDIKCLDKHKHRRATGRPNEVIVENAKRIAKKKEIWARIPLIPNFNDSEEEIQSMARFIKKELGVKKIDLHRYNKLGEVKYERLGRECIHLDPQSEEYIEYLRKMIEKE